MTVIDAPVADEAGAVLVADAPAPVVASPATTIPQRPSDGGAPPTRRQIGGLSARGVMMLIGSIVSSFCLTLLVFGRLTPLSGKIGFTVVFAVLFVVTYGIVVSLDNSIPAVVDRVMTSLLTMSALVAFGALAWVVVYVLWRSLAVIWRPNLYLEDMTTASALTPLSEGGSAHAIVGTLIIIGISLVLTVPLALVCAVFLNETSGPLTNTVRSVVTAMTALPSIIAGLFIFAAWILILGNQLSGFAASLAIILMMLPIVVRSADVVLRLVPGNLREASAALGAPQWRTVWHVVLPTARSGLATAVILGVARGVGETAPVMLVSGFSSSMNLNPFEAPMTSLPLAVWNFVRSGNESMVQRGFGTAAVLMLLVLVLFALARTIGGKPAGQLSKRQQRRAASQSAADLDRIEAAAARRALGHDATTEGVTVG